MQLLFLVGKGDTPSYNQLVIALEQQAKSNCHLSHNWSTYDG